MTDFSLVAVDDQPDFSDVSLVPVDHHPFSVDGIHQARTQLESQPQRLTAVASGKPTVDWSGHYQPPGEMEVATYPPTQQIGNIWPVRMARSISNSMYSAVTLPSDVYQGNVSMVGENGQINPEVIRSAELAGIASPLSPAARVDVGWAAALKTKGLEIPPVRPTFATHEAVPGADTSAGF